MKDDPHLSTVDDVGVGPVLSVIIPCYNERPNVAPMIAKLDAALRGIEWEAIYVDDNSPDGTRPRSAAWPASIPGSAASVASAAEALLPP